MLRHTGSILVALMIVAIAQGQARSTDTVKRTPVQPKSDVQSTLRILNQRLPEVRFEETPFEQVMAWVGDFTKLNISVRWQMLADAGVERDTPISVQARNLRLSQVLWLIMNAAGGTEVKLAYRASGSLLVLSTDDDLGREMVIRIYDVSDLLVRIPRATRQSAFDVTQGMGQNGGGGAGGGGGGGSSGGIFSQGGNRNSTNDTTDQNNSETQMDQIIDLIQQTVEPDSWEANGGVGSIRAFQRSIIVRNSLLVHQQLGGYVQEGELIGR
jgi:uncharacterized membrane protein YgcG